LLLVTAEYNRLKKFVKRYITTDACLLTSPEGVLEAVESRYIKVVQSKRSFHEYLFKEKRQG
jgi:hypothetical protein